MLKRLIKTLTYQSLRNNYYNSNNIRTDLLTNNPRNNNLSSSSIIVLNREYSGFVTRMPSTNTDELRSGPASLESQDDEFDSAALSDLIEAYSITRQDIASKWISYTKSCHIYLYRGGGKPSSSLAGFDLDGTIIKPKSNKRIPKNATDWELFSVWTKVKLQQTIRENNSRFLIFTNQNGVGLRLVSLEEIQERIELVTKRLNIPCTVFVATERDDFRKPKTRMFRLFEQAFNDSMPINYDKSFYCGDAVGYPSHSDADIKFAQTLGLPFLPPEKFLRGVKPKLVGQNLAPTNNQLPEDSSGAEQNKSAL